jgi:2,4-dienoyl-CoA reductase-like NADH-dependent reductase (Old Yellow Enzyme family)
LKINPYQIVKNQGQDYLVQAEQILTTGQADVVMIARESVHF